MLNFQGASLTDVLNYLSEAAGFVIVQEAPVTGTVNVVSRQPITAEDAVDLLNTVLIEKGYVAIRNGRILKIVKREGAQKRDLPVHTGSDPEQIPRKDEMVTQILPLRFGEAAKLVENLRPLLADNCDDQRERKQQFDPAHRHADEHPPHRADHPRHRHLGRRAFRRSTSIR